MTATDMRATTARWLPYRVPHPEARVRLICFPYAGGSASLYRGWATALGGRIDVCPVQLPGRENRLSEAPYTRMQPLVDDVVARIEPLLDRPFALFGYSLGAAIAHETAVRLCERFGRHPIHLFVCARRAPHLPRNGSPRQDLTEDQLKAELRLLNGTPHDVLENAELMELILPALRADLELNDSYMARADSAHSCPVTACGGQCDLEVRPEELAAWSQLTTDRFRLRTFAGDHFFIRHHLADLLTEIGASLGRRD